MKEKRVGTYILGDKIKETYGSCLYKAKKSNDANSEEDYFYLVKQYHNEKIPHNTLQREKEISHEIENHAPKSIVIPILEVLKEEEQEYAVMQFRKNGMFLSELIENLELQYGKGKIPLKITLEVISEILYSLEVLHSFWKKDKYIGYLHLDLHLGNIFFESVDIERQEVGKAKFIDFLSALKMENEEVILNEDAMISMNPNYSSPEQKDGEFYKYRFATDLYSVGAIFFRMLMGRTKTEEEDLEELFSEILEVTGYSIMSDILCTFIDCSMEESSKYRYQNTKDMLRAVEKLKNCYKAYQKKDYYTIFSIAYEMVISIDKADVFLAIENSDIEKLQEAVKCLERDLLKDNIHVSKVKYLFQCLYKCIETQKDKIPADIKYSLYKSGIACNNHIGNSSFAKQLYDEIEELKNDIPIMEYIGCLTRVAVLYADQYEYEKAYEVTNKVVQSFEAIKETYKQVANQNEIRSDGATTRIKDLARAYSAKGTYMVLAKNGDPMPEFEKALQEFGDDIENKKITLAHVLQYAIEMKDKQLYEQYKEQYFGKFDTLSEGIDLVSDKERFHPYTLLIFLKSIYAFYLENMDYDCKNKISKLIESRELRERHSHPIQLIYQYIGLILYEYEKEVTEDIETAMLISMNCLEEGKIDISCPINIMMCMTYQTMWLYNELTEQDEENEELLEIMMEHCKESNWSKLYQELEKTRSIKEVFRYEHC